MKNVFLALLALFGMLVAAPAWALDLQSARSQGLVAERLDGYVAVVKNTSEVSALVAEVNAKRRDEYTRISNEQSQGVEIVGKLAAEQIINHLPAGSLYQSPGGGWAKK